jgi:hypothetical protein
MIGDEKMATVTCPSCGSDDLAKIVSTKSFPIVYGTPAEWEEETHHCLLCGETGNFSDEGETTAEEAIGLAKKRSVNNMLDSLSESGIKVAYLERALELPPRTVSRWKDGRSSASSIALLRIIRTFPWMVEVADARFNKRFAVKKLIQEAGRAIYSAASEVSETPPSASIAIAVDTGKVSISASLEYDAAIYSEYVFAPAVQTLSFGSGE